MQSPEDVKVSAGALGFLDRFAARIASGKWWHLRVAAVALALICLVCTPPFRSICNPSDHWFGSVLTQKVAHPFSPLDVHHYGPREATDDGIESHFEKTTFRLTIPVIGHFLGTGNRSWFVLSVLAALFAYPLFALIGFEVLGSKIDAALLTWAFALSGAGAHFFNDFTFGDGLAFALLLAAIHFRRPAIVFIAVLAAAFTDERALVASAAVALYWYLARPAERKQVIAIAAAAASYIVLRVVIGKVFGLSAGRTDLGNPRIPIYHLAHAPYFAYHVLKGLWFFPVLCGLWLISSRQYARLAMFGAAFLLLFGAAVWVWDFDRSLGYAIVLLPLSWKLLSPLDPKELRLLSQLCLVQAVLLMKPAETPLRFVFHMRN